MRRNWRRNVFIRSLRSPSLVRTAGFCAHISLGAPRWFLRAPGGFVGRFITVLRRWWVQQRKKHLVPSLGTHLPRLRMACSLRPVIRLARARLLLGCQRSLPELCIRFAHVLPKSPRSASRSLNAGTSRLHRKAMHTLRSPEGDRCFSASAISIAAGVWGVNEVLSECCRSDSTFCRKAAVLLGVDRVKTI